MTFKDETAHQICSLFSAESNILAQRPSTGNGNENNGRDNHQQNAPQQQPNISSSFTHRASSSNLNRNLLALVLGLSLIASFSGQIPAVTGLACYETVNGKTTIVQNDSWTYCALVPATIVGNELINGSQFGLGPENDMMTMYNTAFSMSQEEYRILTVCIYERYDFSRFLTIKPDLAVEFAFRCVCNYDLCNSEPTFSAYLSAIKSESFARR